jgi:hypothetical protein
MIHVRIDGRDRRRHRHHGFQRISAFGQDIATRFGSGGVRRRDHAAAKSG